MIFIMEYNNVESLEWADRFFDLRNVIIVCAVITSRGRTAHKRDRLRTPVVETITSEISNAYR